MAKKYRTYNAITGKFGDEEDYSVDFTSQEPVQFKTYNAISGKFSYKPEDTVANTVDTLNTVSNNIKSNTTIDTIKPTKTDVNKSDSTIDTSNTKNDNASYFTKNGKLYREDLVSSNVTGDKDTYTYKNTEITDKNEKNRILNDKSLNIKERTPKKSEYFTKNGKLYKEEIDHVEKTKNGEHFVYKNVPVSKKESEKVYNDKSIYVEDRDEKFDITKQFKDGYQFGDLLRTLNDITTQKIMNPTEQVVNAFQDDPRQTLKTIPVSALSGWMSAFEKANNGLSDTLDDIFHTKNSKEKSMDYANIVSTAARGTKEEKDTLFAEITSKYNNGEISKKDYNYYKELFEANAEENKKEDVLENFVNNNLDYRNTDTYKKHEAGELNPGQEKVWQTGEQLGEQAPTILLSSTIGPAAGKAWFWLQAGQGYKDEALARGYSEKDANKYKYIMGTVESVVEEMGFDQFGGLQKMAEDSLTKAMIGEAMEEFITPYIDGAVRNLEFNENVSVNDMTEEAIDGALSAAVTTAIMSSGSKGLVAVDNVINKINNNQEVTSQELVNAAKELQKVDPDIINDSINIALKEAYQGSQIEQEQEQEQEQEKEAITNEVKQQDIEDTYNALNLEENLNEEIEDTENNIQEAEQQETNDIESLISNISRTEVTKDLENYAQENNIENLSKQDVQNFIEEAIEKQNLNDENKELLRSKYNDLLQDYLKDQNKPKVPEQVKPLAEVSLAQNDTPNSTYKGNKLELKEDSKKGIRKPSEIAKDQYRVGNQLEQQYKGFEDKAKNRMQDSAKAITLDKGKPFNQVDGNFIYVEHSNQLVDRFRRDAATYLKNVPESQAFVKVAEKIIKDKNLEIRFDPNLKSKDGRTANGSYSNGVITLNPTSNRAMEFLLMHEVTHSIATKEMIDMIKTYREGGIFGLNKNTEFDNAVNNLLKSYSKGEVNEEALADISGQLFGNQEFINNLAQDKPSIFKKFYNEIKYLWHQIRGYKNQNEFIQDLYNKWTDAYNNNFVKRTTTKSSKVTMSNQTDASGRQLSQQQAERYKNISKYLRDENGNIIPMFHGTPNGEFTIFHPGSYFSPNKEYASGYEWEGASSISSGKGTTTPKTYEVYLNITNPFTIQDAKAKDIYINEYIKGGNSMYYDPYTDYTNTINNMDEIDWTEGEDLREWLKENHPEYDGLVLDEGGDGGYGMTEYRWRGKSFMPFESNQVKDVDNLNPTDNDDYRYSKELANNEEKVYNKGIERKYNTINEAVEADPRKEPYTKYNTSVDFFNLDYEEMKKAIKIGSQYSLEAQNMGLDSYTFNDDNYIYDFDIINKKNNAFGITNVEPIKSISKEVYDERIARKDSGLSNEQYRLQETANNNDNKSIRNKETSRRISNLDKETTANELEYNEEKGIRNNKELDNSSFSLKQKQNEIVQKYNPKDEELGEHTWINSVDDIKTFKEALNYDDYESGNLTPDFTENMVQDALKTGKVTVYSSYPIEQGTFVTPSKMEAESYAGSNKVYSKEVPLQDVAWIDSLQGQYAKVDKKFSKDSSGNKLSKGKQEYFKDSKAVNDKGELQVVYHGTNHPGFTVFKPAQGNSAFGKYKFGNYDVNYFTASKDTARGYTDIGVEENNNIYEGYLNITNPYTVENTSPSMVKSWNNLRDDNIRQYETDYYDKFEQKWNNDDRYIEDVIDELNEELFPFNHELRYNDGYYELYDLGNNSLTGNEEMKLYVDENATTNELFDEELKEAIYGDRFDDYYYTSDDIAKWIITQNTLDGKNYDGIIIPDIMDNGPKGNMFGEPTTDYITFKPNQFKNINNENPTDNEDIRFSKENESWREYLEREFPATGTRTSFDTATGRKITKPTKTTTEEKTTEKIASNEVNNKAYETMQKYVDTGRDTDFVDYHQLDNGNIIARAKDGTYSVIEDNKVIVDGEKIPSDGLYMQTNSSMRRDLLDLNDNDFIDVKYSTEEGTDSTGKKVKLKQTADNVYERETKPTKNQIMPETKNESVKIGDKKVSNFYSNITEKSKFITEENRESLKDNENLKYYDAITNKETLRDAMDNLDSNPEQTVGDFFTKENFTADDVATGWILMKRYQDAGNYEAMSNVIEKMREQGTKSGQAIQMLGMLDRLTPEGMEYYAQKQLDNAYNKFTENKSKKQIEKYANDFTLTAEEHQFIKDQMEKVGQLEDEDAKKVEVAKIVKMLSDKLPPEKGSGIKAWMRIAMLGNAKTQVRNIMGNAIIQPVNWTGDIFGNIVDKAISKKTGVRTKGNTDFGALVGGFIKGGKDAIRDARLGIDTRDINLNRFEENIGAKPFYEHGKSKVLNAGAKALNKINQITGDVMSGGDRIFYQSIFDNSLKNQMKLNGVTTPTQEMVDIATQEALSRTWNDSNSYTKAVLQIRSAMNKLNIKGYGLGDVLVPFAKTPANLTKAIVDYSPVGLARSILQDGKNLKNSLENGQYNAQMQHKFADSFGKGVAGSILWVTAYALAKAGITSGASDDDKDVANFMRNTMGIQPYSIKIGNKSFTYDWAQPIAAPLAAMADFQRLSEKEEKDLGSIIKTMTSSASNILLEQSFLSSIQDVFNSYNGPTEAIQTQIQDLPARATPTFFKQIADLIDPKQRQTYVKGNEAQTTKNKVQVKIPGASKKLVSQRDTLGREIEKYGGDDNKLQYAFNVFLNPANTNKGKPSEAAAEIYDVYKNTGDKTVMPRQVGYSEYIDGKSTPLTPEERNKWQKLAGEKVEESVKALAQNEKYQQMDYDDKAAVINGIVNYSFAKAKSEVFDIPISNTYKTPAKKEEQGIPLYDYYVDRVSKRK